MVTGTQLLCHLFGDYVLQSSWMAINKEKRWFPAIVHVIVYLVPFIVFLHPTFTAILVMFGTHVVIDRYRLARYVSYFSQLLAPPKEWRPWGECCKTGFDKDTPEFLAVWLTIIVDNTIHITINGLALTYL